MTASSLISPVSLATLARISPLALPVSTRGVLASNSDSSPSTIVTLSSNGRLLSALSSLQNQLADSLSVGQAAASPADTKVLAQNLVATFNNLQGSASALNGVLGNDTVSSLLAGALTNNPTLLASLSGIGIDLPAASSQFVVNQDTLDAALASAPTATGSILDNAAQAVLNASSSLELQVAGLAVAQANPSPTEAISAATDSGSGVPIEQLQNLSADSILNNVQLGDINLAAAGQTADAISTVPALLQTSLSAGLPGANDTVFPVTANPAQSVGNDVVAPAGGSVQSVTSGAVDNASTTALPLGPGPPTSIVAASPGAVATPATGNGDAAAADLRSATAQMALQKMLSDPAQQILRNILDPYFPALVAATRSTEMSTFAPVIDPQAFAPDLPTPVLAIQRVRAIG